jgi:hypothetical protein
MFHAHVSQKQRHFQDEWELSPRWPAVARLCSCAEPMNGTPDLAVPNRPIDLRFSATRLEARVYTQYPLF